MTKATIHSSVEELRLASIRRKSKENLSPKQNFTQNWNAIAQIKSEEFVKNQ